MVAIINFPTIDQDALQHFRDVLPHVPQRRHFAEYLTGRFVAERKNVTGIHREFAHTTDQSCLNRFFTEASWDPPQLNQRRLDLLQRDPTLRYNAHGLAALLAGKSVTESAAAALVDRTTVHRWAKDDVSFMAALNRGRREFRDALHGRLMVLAEQAAACVEKQIADGDGKTALAVLKGLGLLTGEPRAIGSDDPLELARKKAQDEAFAGLFPA